MLFMLSWIFMQDIQEELTVRRVELDVRVFNLAQNPVMGLDPQKFAIKEDGKKMAVANFEEINYLDLIPGETFDTPRVLFLFNLLDDPRHISNYINEVEDLLLYKELGAWQVGFGYADLGGIYIVESFSDNQDHWIEGINRIRGHYEASNAKVMFSKANPTSDQDVSQRWSNVYGFNLQNPAQAPIDPNADPSAVRPSGTPFGTDSIEFVEKTTELTRHDPRALSRFVRLLGTYHGVKEIIVLGDPLWDRSITEPEHWTQREGIRAGETASTNFYYSKSNSTGNFGSSADQETGFDVNEILTRCVQNKIRFSRLALTDSGQNIRDEFVSMCGGFLYPSNRTAVDENLERYLNQAGHFYRVAYETEIPRSDLRYRNVSVSVKGLNLMAEHVGRFYPFLLGERNDLRVSHKQVPVASVEYKLPWRSLVFEKDEEQVRAQLAIGQRIFTETHLVFEDVKVYNPKKPQTGEGNGNMTEDDLTLTLDLPVYEEGFYKVEFIAIDLLTGGTTTLTTEISL